MEVPHRYRRGSRRVWRLCARGVFRESETVRRLFRPARTDTLRWSRMDACIARSGAMRHPARRLYATTGMSVRPSLRPSTLALCIGLSLSAQAWAQSMEDMPLDFSLCPVRDAIAPFDDVPATGINIGDRAAQPTDIEGDTLSGTEVAPAVRRQRRAAPRRPVPRRRPPAVRQRHRSATSPKATSATRTARCA